MIVIGRVCRRVPFGDGNGGGSGQPSTEQEKKVEFGRDGDDAGPMPQKLVLDSRMYCTEISLGLTVKSAGDDKPQRRKCSKYSGNRI